MSVDKLLEKAKNMKVTKVDTLYNHRPAFVVDNIIRTYEERDGVKIKYVCSTELDVDDMVCDVYYRETPHPEFGNRYFGLFLKFEPNGEYYSYIRNADVIETLQFGMIEHEGVYHYSNARHDYLQVGDTFIDGGRAYVRTGGKRVSQIRYFKVKDGEFVEE